VENDVMRIVVADEISPDSCRLWDIKSNEKLDKDRFRRDLGGCSKPIPRLPSARHHGRGRTPAGHRSGAGEGVTIEAPMGVPRIDLAPMSVEDFFAFTDSRPDDERWELIDGEPV